MGHVLFEAGWHRLPVCFEGITPLPQSQGRVTAGSGLLGEALRLEPVSLAQPHGPSLVSSVYKGGLGGHHWAVQRESVASHPTLQ